MKQWYIVGGNALEVTTPDGGLRAWRALEGHYGPFEVARQACVEPALAVDIRPGRMSVPDDAELIYEPDYGGIGLIASRASRMADGGLLIELRHIDETATRVWMTMSPRLDRADVVLAPDGDDDDPYFVTHAVMVAYMLATCGAGTLMVHASTVVCGGRAYLFQGKSGTGKSTHAALWTRNVAGAELLNDDHPVIRLADDGGVTVYGSPWSGKTDCYRNVSAPVGACVRIVRAGDNELLRLDALRGYASLTASVFYMPFMSEEQRAARHRVLERMATSVPCCEMHCRPDAEAALTCHAALGAMLKFKLNQI